MKREKLAAIAKNRAYAKQHRFYKKSYEKGGAEWSGDGSPNPMFAREIVRLKSKLKRKIALDLGSGEGRHSVFLRWHRFKVIGIEYQALALKNAAGKGTNGLLYVRGDIFRIPLKPGAFDLVLDSGVFHHIRRKHTAPYLELLRSLLVPGGYLLLSCFSTKFRHGNGKVYPRGFVVHKGHYDRFSTVPELRRIFAPAFECVRIKAARNGLIDALFRLKL